MEIVKVNPTEFGLEVSKAKQIEDAFTPAIVERDALISIYEELITGELTPGLSKRAHDLNKQFGKVCTNINKIHKAEKNFYLSGGRFVDAWKNKNMAPIEVMRDKLKEISTHFEKIEAARVIKLQAERSAELIALDVLEKNVPGYLGDLSEDNWNITKTGYKHVFETKQKEAEDAKIQAEKDAAEAKKLENARLEEEKARAEKAKKAAAAKLNKEREEAAQTLKEKERVNELWRSRLAKLTGCTWNGEDALRPDGTVIISYKNMIFISDEAFEGIALKFADEMAVVKAKKEKAAIRNKRTVAISEYKEFIPADHKDDDLSELTETEWIKRLEWTKKQKEDADLAIKAKADKDAQNVARQNDLVQAGFRYNASSKTFECYNVVLHIDEVIALSGPTFAKRLNEAMVKIKAIEDKAADDLKIKEDELKRLKDAEIKKAAEAKALKLAPERTKLKNLAAVISAIEVPSVETDEALVIVSNTRVALSAIVKMINEAVSLL